MQSSGSNKGVEVRVGMKKKGAWCPFFYKDALPPFSCPKLFSK